MTIKEYLELKNKTFQECQEMDEREFAREALLDFNNHNIECTEDEFCAFLWCMVAEKQALKPLGVEETAKQLHNKYLVSAFWNNGKPKIEESFEVWFNLESDEISVEKPLDAFGENDSCVKIEDYRIIDGINWKDLVL